MKILVINTAASEGGALSILKDFTHNILMNDSNNEWVFLLSGEYIQENSNIKTIVIPELKNNITRLKFENLTGKGFIENEIKPDIVFSMQNTLINNLTIPQLLYLHQPLPFQEEKDFSLFKETERELAIKQKFLGKYIKKNLNKAQKIIVQTKWLKEAVKNCGVDHSKVVVIAPSIKIPLSVTATSYNTNEFIYPTSDILYKDIDVIEKASELLLEKDIEFKVEITANRVNKHNIQYIGKVSRDVIFEKLQSKVLLFPSFIETFGLPLAEARELNAIILASNTVFAREVLFNYPNVYYFEVGNYRELASLMEKCIANSIVKKEKKLDKIETINSWTKVRNIIYEAVI